MLGRKARGSASSSSSMSISTSLTSLLSSTSIVDWAEELGTLSTCSSSEEEDWSWPKVFLKSGAIAHSGSQGKGQCWLQLGTKAGPIREGYCACPRWRPKSGKAVVPVPEVCNKLQRDPLTREMAVTREGAVVPVF